MVRAARPPLPSRCEHPAQAWRDTGRRRGRPGRRSPAPGCAQGPIKQCSGDSAGPGGVL